MMKTVMSPWIPVSKQNQNGHKVSLSFSSFYLKYHWIMIGLCLQNSFKNNIMDIYASFEVNKAAGKQNFSVISL